MKILTTIFVCIALCDLVYSREFKSELDLKKNETLIYGNPVIGFIHCGFDDKNNIKYVLISSDDSEAPLEIEGGSITVNGTRIVQPYTMSVDTSKFPALSKIETIFNKVTFIDGNVIKQYDINGLKIENLKELALKFEDENFDYEKWILSR